MIAVPAIDLREGCCVQLVGGEFDAERVRITDPLAVADRWAEAGFTRLHVVDLDAALGRGANTSIVEALGARTDLRAQIGGGVRTREDVGRKLALGFERVVVGTRAVADPEWLRDVATSWPGRVVVAADSRDGMVVTHGWQTSAGRAVVDVVAELSELPLAAVLVTAVEREGLMAGPDVDLISKLASASRIPIIASGGIGALHHLESLAEAGAAEAVIGMALYTGALDPRVVAREFS